jgi:hypothetical protein
MTVIEERISSLIARIAVLLPAGSGRANVISLLNKLRTFPEPAANAALTKFERNVSATEHHTDPSYQHDTIGHPRCMLCKR